MPPETGTRAKENSRIHPRNSNVRNLSRERQHRDRIDAIAGDVGLAIDGERDGHRSLSDDGDRI